MRYIALFVFAGVLFWVIGSILAPALPQIQRVLP